MTDRTEPTTKLRRSATAEMQQVAVLFNNKAAGWSEKYTPDGPLAGRLADFADVVGQHVPADALVLDLGCGTGELARHLATTGRRLTACDISTEMLGRAAAADIDNSVEWLQLGANWRRLPLESAKFDAVVAASVLEYVDEPLKVLGECARVLRPGGLLVCTVPDPAHPVRKMEWLLARVARLLPASATSCRWHRLAGYLAYLRVSRNRHAARWWDRAATQVGLRPFGRTSGRNERSPLRLLLFWQPER
jgi:SAM-dependent methyltransferase